MKATLIVSDYRNLVQSSLIVSPRAGYVAMGLAVANMFVGGFLAPDFTKSTSQWPALPWVVAIVSTMVMIGVVATRAVETARAIDTHAGA